jgi:hypothetical protein
MDDQLRAGLLTRDPGGHLENKYSPESKISEESAIEKPSGGRSMQSGPQAALISKKTIWAGRAISALVVLFLVFDSLIKFVKPAPVVTAFAHLGLPESTAVGIGILLLACTALYAIPRTSILGAILLTGYLGGAVATHLRVGDPLFSHVLFPTYVGALVWLGLYLRDSRLRALIPLRTPMKASEIR